MLYNITEAITALSILVFSMLRKLSTGLTTGHFKLLNRVVPILLVRILLYWYRTQTFCIKWGTMTSCFFSVSNGVRQGGILSPYLFAIYMDDLSVTLNNAKVGCHINNRCANHVICR